MSTMYLENPLLPVGHKRASEDLVGAACFDDAFNVFMNAMSEPKKLKLDPLAFISAPAPASKSASAAAAVAAAAVLNFNATASASTVSAPDPSGNPPSRVVHLRNIPGDMSELELIHFCMPFGKLSNYLMLKGKNQAFVEYEEDSGAQAIVQIAHAYPMAIRGKTIFCQYSTHQGLKTEKKLPTKSGAILGDLIVPPEGRASPVKTVAANCCAAQAAAATAAVQLAAVNQPTPSTNTIKLSAGLKRAHSPELTGAPIVDQSNQIALAAAAAAATNSVNTQPVQSPFHAFQQFQSVQQLLQSQQNNLAYYESLNAKRLRLAAPVVSSFGPNNLLMAASAPLRPLIPNNVGMTPCDQQQMVMQNILNGKQNEQMQKSNLLVLGGATTPTGQSSNALGSNSRGSATPASASQLDISTGTQQQPNSVLRVIVDNMICPVTLDILYSIFSRYGKVLRIITFSKNHTFQALIQFSEANAAQNAKNTLDGQNIFNNCCNLRIDYSKLATLNVKYNNDKSRDYTNPLLPPGELSLEQQLSLAQNSLVVPSLIPFAGNPANSVANLYSQQNVLAGGLGTNIAALMAATNGSNGMASPSLNVTAQTLLQQQLGSLLNTTPVVLVSNLDHKKVTPDALFTLFGVYGDVQRVKILFNKKDNALVQYAECQQAQLAIQHLDKAKWHDKVIRVASSKHTNVQMPKEGQPDVGLTRDYTNSPLHRFKKPGSKNYMNIYPPSSTLHLSNIPPNITLEFLKGAFEENGFQVKDFQFFQRDHKMALVQLEDVETAIQALVIMHNFKLADNAHLRVSFSKKGLRV